MDQSRLRGPSRLRVEAHSIDLGNEPPLSVDGGTAGIIDRRRVSAQWFSGTILTGLCGAALMGGAVFAALDGETNFAALPDFVQSALRGTADRMTTTRKSDRLPPAGDANAARQVIKISTPTRGIGDREVMRVVPHVRVTANLALSTSELSASIPPFNAQRLLAEAGADGTPVGDTGAEPDGEITFVTRDLGRAAAAHARRHRAADRRRARARARGRELGRTEPRRALHGCQRNARRHQDELRARTGGPRPLCGLRGPHRSRKHHLDAEDRRRRPPAAIPGASAPIR